MRKIEGASHEWEHEDSKRYSVGGEVPRQMQVEDAFDYPRIEKVEDKSRAWFGDLAHPIAQDDLVSSNPKRAFGNTKPSPHLIPPIAIIEESIALGLGAKKYGPYNWSDQPVDASTYYSAAMRHLMAWYTGEDADPDTGTTHLGNVRACMAILIDAQTSGSMIDDRPKTASAAEAVRRLTVANSNVPLPLSLDDTA